MLNGKATDDSVGIDGTHILIGRKMVLQLKYEQSVEVFMWLIYILSFLILVLSFGNQEQTAVVFCCTRFI